MAANGSHPGSGKDPWRSSPEEGPPDLTHLFKKFFGQKSKKPGQVGGNHAFKSPVRFLGLVILAILAIWLLSGIFLVSPAEQSIVLRFGKYVKTLGPGPHWLPTIFESRYTANIQRVDSFPYEAEMLTQDGNIVNVKIQVQYRIGDLKEYLFNVVSPTVALQQAASSALRQVVGRMDLDPILTVGREELAQQVMTLLQQTLKNYQSGIEVREVTLQSSKPPEAVTAAFDDVIKATEDEKRYINQAEAYAKKRVLIAEGGAARIKQEADAYRYSVVTQATGATIRYLALLKPYQQAPEITRERLYLDTVGQVLKNTNNILVEGTGNNVLYLPLEQLLARPKNSEDTGSPQAATQEMSAVTTQSIESAGSSGDGFLSTIGENLSRPTYPAPGGKR